MEAKAAIIKRDADELAELSSGLRTKFSSVEDALQGDSTNFAILLNKSKSLATKLASGPVVETDSLDQQQNESLPNYLSRMAKRIEAHQSYSDVLKDEPQLLARYYNHITDLIGLAQK